MQYYLLEAAGALWRYKPGSKVHAELTSGLHSDLFLNITRLVEDPCALSRVCESLVSRTSLSGLRPRFVGSAMGGITIAHECARITGGRMAYTEKVGDLMELSRFDIGLDELVVVVEDVLTTGGTTIKTINALERSGITPAPTVLAVVNRSGAERLRVPPPNTLPEHSAQIISVIQPTAKNYKPHVCPMCSTGSEALRPKQHWERFRE